MDDYEAQVAAFHKIMNDSRKFHAYSTAGGPVPLPGIDPTPGTTLHEILEDHMSVQPDTATFPPRDTARQYVNGTGTSQDMAARESASGAMSRRQNSIRNALEEVGPLGMTSAEMGVHLGGEATGNHHGKVSGAMSAMHRDGMIASLQVRRAGAYVYVTLDNVGGRPTRAYGGKSGGQTADAVQAGENRAALDEQNRRDVAEIQRLRNRLDARPRLTEMERETIDQIEKALPGLRARHAPAVPLKIETASMLLAALRRLDG